MEAETNGETPGDALAKLKEVYARAEVGVTQPYRYRLLTYSTQGSILLLELLDAVRDYLSLDPE